MKNQLIALSFIGTLMFGLIGSGVAGDEADKKVKVPAPELPIFESEKKAERRMMVRLKKHVKTSGVVLKKVVPKPTVKRGNFTAFGVELQIYGDSKQVANFIGEVEDRDRFKVVSMLEIVPDRKDPKLQNAKLVLSNWYALDENATKHLVSWRAVVSPAVPVIEIYLAWLNVLEDPAIRVVGFEMKEKSIRVVGEGQGMKEAGKFGGEIFNEAKLQGYDWSWEKRPAFSAENDGTVKFSIHGQLREPAKKEGE